MFLSTLTSVNTIAQTSGYPASASTNGFGPSNPFYALSTLPFQAPPFDKIRDDDFRSAIEAGMTQQKSEIEAIANNPDEAIRYEPPAGPLQVNSYGAISRSGYHIEKLI